MRNGKYIAICTATLLFIGSVSIWARGSSTATPSTPPHPLAAEVQADNLRLPEGTSVLIINIDSLRADRMGAYGYSKETTPFLDSLFAQGVTFENAIAPAYLTFQTDASIFSGLYPSQHNMATWDTPIDKTLKLFPKRLSELGYKTAAFVSPSLWEYFGLKEQFDEYVLNPNMKNIAEVRPKVTEWIGSRQGKQPFFLFWHIYDVHAPYVKAREEFYTGEYGGPFADKEIRWDWESQSKTAFRKRGETVASAKLTQEDVEYLKASYDSGIKTVDEELEQFFSSLKERGALENTLVIISSEHGEDLKEHGFIFHRDLYDVNIRVPLAFIHPALKPQWVAEPVSLLDILPTVLGTLGVSAPEYGEGRDLRPLLSGKDEERSVFTERAPFNEYAIRTSEWKYILRNPEKKSGKEFEEFDSSRFMWKIVVNDDDGGDELYNLKNDPTEQKNLVGRGFAIEAELKQEVEAFRLRMRAAREVNKATREIVKRDKVFSYP